MKKIKTTKKDSCSSNHFGRGLYYYNTLSCKSKIMMPPIHRVGFSFRIIKDEKNKNY